MADFEQEEAQRREKRERMAKVLPTFEEIYNMKVEAELQEKAKQSAYDGKSIGDILSASNKGLTPRRAKNYFRFGGNEVS